MLNKKKKLHKRNLTDGNVGMMKIAKDINLHAGTHRELERLQRHCKDNPSVHLDFQSLLELTNRQD